MRIEIPSDIQLALPCSVLMWSPACSVRGVVAETRQIHMDYQVLWRERTAQPLSQGESAPTLATTGFYFFSWHITMRMVLITMHRFVLGGYLLQKTKERMLLITSKRKDIYKCKGKSG